jgi:hypothetical protein
MPNNAIPKLLARNAAAFRRGKLASDTTRVTAGNSVATRLESAIGNCYPGLECDLRNLERRFFPFLVVDYFDGRIEIVEVDVRGVAAAAAAGAIKPALAAIYQEIAAAPARKWHIDRIKGNFGPLGIQAFAFTELDGNSFGPGRRPPDPWTAIRLLVEDSRVTIDVQRERVRRTLSGKRCRYLSDAGALAEMFAPGELSQSLCSPWTHDFRDCGCFYWASNHPDIALPPKPDPNTSDVRFDHVTRWERQDRAASPAPQDTIAGDNAIPPMDHYEINHKWQTLNFVLEGREIPDGRYAPSDIESVPLPDVPTLIQHLRYAAGVELRAIHLYLAAAYSLKDPTQAPRAVRDNVRVAHAEIMRVAVGEMLHLRAVNDVLRGLAGQATFIPALQVASQLPIAGGKYAPFAEHVADGATIQSFIDLERPSTSIDGLYARILVTLQDEDQRQCIRTIMAEGEDHFRTFRFVSVWLGQDTPPNYLRNLKAPAAGNSLHTELQKQYYKVLLGLRAGYSKTRLAGAPDINSARDTMLANPGIYGAAQALTNAGFLLVFDPLTGPFTPIAPPPSATPSLTPGRAPIPKPGPRTNRMP